MTSERYMALDPETFDALIEAVRRFVAERLRPLEAQVEDEDAVPEAIVAEMRGLGLFGLSIAEAYGGLGLTMAEEAYVAIEFGRTTPAFRSTFGTNVGIRRHKRKSVVSGKSVSVRVDLGGSRRNKKKKDKNKI